MTMKKSKACRPSCDLCARDIVDYCNSTDWVQLNQPVDNDSKRKLRLNLILKNPSGKRRKGQRQDTIRRKICATLKDLAV